MARISAQLNELALEALNLGFGCFSDGDRVPFVMIDDQDTRHLIDFQSVNQTSDRDLVAAARDTVAQTFPKAHRYVLVWDGYLTTDDVKRDAVFAEAGEHGGKQAIIFAQPYRPKNRGKTLERIGEPLAVQLTTNLLKAGNRKR
jgi:hypothetical protein